MHEVSYIWVQYFWASLKGNGPEALVQTVVYSLAAYVLVPPFRKWVNGGFKSVHAKLDQHHESVLAQAEGHHEQHMEILKKHHEDLIATVKPTPRKAPAVKKAVPRKGTA